MPIQLSGSLLLTGSLTATSTITAQTLVVQTITSSVVQMTGSNVFGSTLANTQTFTGSAYFTGSIHSIYGNVGIGTTNPSHNLTFEVSASSPTIRFYDGANNNYIGAAYATGNLATGTGAGNLVLRSSTGIAFSTNNGSSVAVAISSSGFIGIGITNPPQIMTIAGGTTTPGSFSGGNYYFGLYSGSASTVLRETFALGSDASYVYMQSFSSKPLYINQAGNNIILGSTAGANNVGIGITNPDANLVIGNLSTPGKGSINGASGTINRAIINCPYPGASALTLGYYSSAYGLDIWVNGDGTGLAPVYIDQRNAEAIIFRRNTQGTAAESMRITGGGTIISQNGNIVLGTNNNASYSSTTAYTLFIANAGSEGSVAQGQIAFGEVTSYGINTTRIGAAITTYYSDTYSRLGLIFKTKNTADDAGPVERLRITAAGTTVFSGPTLTAGGQGTYALQIGEAGYANLTLGYKQSTAGYIQTWSSTALYLNQQGNAVYAGSVRLDTLSDQRIKDNIQPITGCLDKVLQLNGKKFHLKDEPEDKIRYGFIAQDLEGILDEFVINTDMKFEKDGEVVENVKSIENWASSWSALLVEAIKELKAENDTLKERITILEQK